MSSTRRPGAALILALLAIVVLDCIVLGTLHLALQEQRIGANRVTVLQLRLDAESGVRQALGLWNESIDTIPAGSAGRIALPAAQTAGAAVQIERLSDHVFLIESVTAEAPPRVGRAVARLLVEPPPLQPNVDPAPAPLSSGGAVHLLASSSVITSPPPDCPAAPAQYSVLAPLPGVTIEPGATLDAPPGPPEPQPLTGTLDRLFALAPDSV
ncbi:MAG: hypothetical protein KFH98_08505, partial [Gemmatimonadetes bacterium]|nr:hypothetical protein [Gemmatimonadota bacterium]